MIPTALAGGSVRAIGCDLEPVARIGRIVERHDEETLSRVFTLEEQARCRATPEPALAFTATWAAKEAVAKALGTGFSGFPMSAVVARLDGHRVFVELDAIPRALAREKRVSRWSGTWRLCGDMVFAQVIAE